MIKILILQNKILHYRKAVYNKMAERYNVTVLHSGKPSVGLNDNYNEIIVEKRKYGILIWQSGLIKEARNIKYDAIIAMCDLHWISNILAMYFHCCKIKFIWWGSWLNKKVVNNKIKIYLAKKAHSNIFYSKDAKLSFKNAGVNEKKLFLANNTFDVGEQRKCYNHLEKKRVLFVGSLEARKQNSILIEAFRNILKQISSDVLLTFIGDGKEKNELIRQVNILKIEERAIFKDKITESAKLVQYFNEAIVSVSFGQAGLSVLQSFGYGVPFLTKKNAISGGEKTNIIHMYNGLLCEDSIKSLEIYLAMLCNNVQYTRNLGKNAYNYYHKYCTIEKMVQGMSDAIERD